MTAANSSRLKNTKAMQEESQTFNATMYETLGRAAWYCLVIMVSRLVTPRVTLAGTASGGIQKVSIDMMTMRTVGI